MWSKGFMVSLLSHLSLSPSPPLFFFRTFFVGENQVNCDSGICIMFSILLQLLPLSLSPLLHFSLPLSVHFYVSLSRPLSLSLSPLLHFSRSSPTPPPPPSLSQNPLGNFLICCFMFVLLGRETFLNAKNKRKTNLWN